MPSWVAVVSRPIRLTFASRGDTVKGESLVHLTALGNQKALHILTGCYPSYEASSPYAGGWFLHNFLALVVQRIEQPPSKRRVAGSNPA